MACSKKKAERTWFRLRVRYHPHAPKTEEKYPGTSDSKEGRIRCDREEDASDDRSKKRSQRAEHPERAHRIRVVCRYSPKEVTFHHRFDKSRPYARNDKYEHDCSEGSCHCDEASRHDRESHDNKPCSKDAPVAELCIRKPSGWVLEEDKWKEHNSKHPLKLAPGNTKSRMEIEGDIDRGDVEEDLKHCARNGDSTQVCVSRNAQAGFFPAREDEDEGDKRKGSYQEHEAVLLIVIKKYSHNDRSKHKRNVSGCKKGGAHASSRPLISYRCLKQEIELIRNEGRNRTG